MSRSVFPKAFTLTVSVVGESGSLFASSKIDEWAERRGYWPRMKTSKSSRFLEQRTLVPTPEWERFQAGEKSQ